MTTVTGESIDTTPGVFTTRPYEDADIQGVCDLINTVDAVDHLDDNYSVEDLQVEFSSPEIDRAKDLRVWLDGQGRVAGFGQIWHRKVDVEGVVDVGVYWKVHPDVREQGIEDEIIAFGEARAREIGTEKEMPVRYGGGAKDTDLYSIAVWERHGMAPVRYFFTMARDLTEPIPEPQVPEGYTIRHCTGHDDTVKWVEAFNQSFIDHWNFQPRTVETVEHWLSDPKYVPERDIVIEAPDGRFASFAFCWIDPEANERNNRSEGWVWMLGTARGFRKMGLGTAALVAGMRRMRDDGMTVAKLGVDAENPTGALRLYEATGFVVETKSTAYRKMLG